ncbi:MAG: amidohydrolase family protein [Deltaproteobacteria bacterium]
MMIDVYTHILPPKYLEERNKRAGAGFKSQYAKYPIANPGLTDLNIRFRIMDKFKDLVHVLTIAGPNVESITSPKDAVELAKIANDEMAELVLKYPDRFVGAVACLPMNDVDAALKEADRTINELKFRGIEIFTDINGKPVDSPEFWPFYEKMEAYNLPVLLHPRRENTRADYAGEPSSKYLIYTNFGWPYESSVAMARLAFSGVFEKYPNLKVLTHHAGGMVPFFAKRVQLSHDFNRMRMGYTYDPPITKAPLDYYRLFYCDTAIQGNAPALMCAYDFFGADHMLFGTDMPYDNQLGERATRETIDAILEMTLPEIDRKKIFEDNARKLFRLPV